eukprot:XP_002257836.1 hypothetical protein, conserved in Plasmodium species [Plasmodium knowlesi strain H]
MITLKDAWKKERSSFFLFKRTLILSLLLWICQHCNNEGTISKTLGIGHSVRTTPGQRYNRLLVRHELINKVDEESIKEQLGYNTQRKSVLLEDGNKLDKEEAKRSKVKSGNSSKNEDVKGFNLKFGRESKKAKGKNGNQKIKSELKNGNKIKKEEKEKKLGQKSENKMTVGVGAERNDQKSDDEICSEKVEEEGGAEVGAQRDDQRSDDEISAEKVEGEGDDQTGEEKLIYEVNEVNDNKECENKEPKNKIINVEVFLEKKVKNKRKINVVVTLEKILKDKDELINNEDYSIGKESINYIDAEGNDGDKLGNLGDHVTPNFDDILKLDKDKKDDKKRKSKNTKKEMQKKIFFRLKKLMRILKFLNIIGMAIETVNKIIDKHIEKVMFKAYAKVDEYKKDPNISKMKYQLIKFTYKGFFFIIPIIIIAGGISLTQVTSVVSYGSTFIIMLGVSFLIGNIKRSIRYQFKKKGIDNPGILDYLDLLLIFLSKFEKKEGNPEGENAYGQNVYGQNAYGQNAYGQNAYGQNATGENATGENAIGENAIGENAIGENAIGENEPVKMQPVKMQPVKMQPVKMQPVKMQPVKIQPVKMHMGRKSLPK